MARFRRVRPDDELTLVEHLDELRTRLIVSISALTVAVAVCYYEQHRIYHALRGPIHYHKLYVFSPTEGFFNAVMISVYGGLLITLPILTYQLYAYIVPAFSEDSQRSIRPLLLMVPGLFVLGVAFGWYVVIPPAITFLTGFDKTEFVYALRASDYIRFIMLTLVAMGIVFELPVVMMMLGRVGILRSSFMKRRWREAVVVLAVVAAILPGTDPVTMTAEYVPMLVLYGFSYFLVKAVEPKPSAPDYSSPEPSG